jgi:HSP20 family molecular chaperone IbpA
MTLRRSMSMTHTVVVTGARSSGPDAQKSETFHGLRGARRQAEIGAQSRVKSRKTRRRSEKITISANAFLAPSAVSFRIPKSVDTDKIEASFKMGELTVTLPKKPEAQKPAKKINVKSA